LHGGYESATQKRQGGVRRSAVEPLDRSAFDGNYRDKFANKVCSVKKICSFLFLFQLNHSVPWLAGGLRFIFLAKLQIRARRRFQKLGWRDKMFFPGGRNLRNSGATYLQSSGQTSEGQEKVPDTFS
jgi:hypothetical protein